MHAINIRLDSGACPLEILATDRGHQLSDRYCSDSDSLNNKNDRLFAVLRFILLPIKLLAPSLSERVHWNHVGCHTCIIAYGAEAMAVYGPR